MQAGPVLKRVALASLALWALPSFAADARREIDRFFDDMAIVVPRGQQSRFVAGDNLAGYFEAYTQGYTKGEGYVTRRPNGFVNYSTGVDGRRNERGRSREQVLPYGHRVIYPHGVTEELALLSKKNAIAMRVSSARPAELAITPMLKTAPAYAQVSAEGEVVIIAPHDPDGQFIAFAADQPVIRNGGLMLRSAARTRSLTVVAGFGASAQEAASRAQALVRAKPIEAERAAVFAALTRSVLTTSDRQYNRALNWAKASSRMFVVEEFGTGIWAGLPWFRDNWGRDTFIALPGTLLVQGEFEQAKAVLANFARYQNLRLPREREYGRIPNRVAIGESIIYNTVDGTPWMLREGMEYIRYSGDTAFAAELYKLAVPYLEGAIANYMDADGLLTHDDADTWMDARIEGRQPWSARGPRAAEIQALWFNALQNGASLAQQAGDAAHAQQWTALAERARASFMRLFWDGHTMADRLRFDASRDTKVRPNQLMLISIPEAPFVPLDVQAQVLKNAVPELLYPYGVASLSQDDGYFHPRHENAEFHHKDAAYHQGTVWGWNAGFTITALNKFGYQDLAWSLTQNLGQQILCLGTLGTMSELLDALPDAQGKLKPSGTFAQSWSVAEYARNGFQDYVGFHPNLPSNQLELKPAIPKAWRHFHARLPFGAGEALVVDFRRVPGGQQWRLSQSGTATRTISFDTMGADRSRSRVAFALAPGKPMRLDLSNGRATLDGQPLAQTTAQASFATEIGELRFRTPKVYRPQDFPMLQGRDVLKAIVERQEYR
jgi:glycogen debranching enzyme